MQILQSISNAVKSMFFAPGTIIMDGYIDWDGHNKRWKEPAHRYEDMRNMKRDPVVRGMLRAWKLPILNAGGRVEPASDKPEDMRVQEFVKDVLWGSKTSFNFDNFMKDLLEYNEFGFYVAAKRMQVIENKMYFDRFIELIPETVTRWYVDKNFNLDRVKQENAFNSFTGMYETHDIDKDLLFFIAGDVEGNNFEGESILSAAYGAWYRKQKFLILKGIQAEKGSVGIQRGTLARGQSNNSTKKAELINVLKSLRSHENSYIAQTEGDYILDYIGGKDLVGLDLIPLIDQENKEIVEAINAGFLQQSKGESGVGSQAKQENDIEFFKLGVAASQKFIDSVINNGYMGTQGLIKPLVKMNFPNVTEYPKYISNDCYEDDIEILLRSVQMAKNSGFLTATNDDEMYVRGKLGMPEVELPEEREKPMVPGFGFEPDEDEPEDGEETEPDEDEPSNKFFAQAERKRGRKVTPELLKLEKKLRIESMREELNSRQSNVEKAINPFVKDTRDQLVAAAQNLLLKKKSITDIQAALKAMTIPNTVKITNTLIRYAKENFLYGKNRVMFEHVGTNIDTLIRYAKENFLVGTNIENMMFPDLTIMNIPFADITDVSKEAEKAIRPTAEIAITNFANKLKLEFDDVVLSQFKQGEINTTAIRSGLERVSDSVFQKEVKKTMNEAFGTGRNVELKRQGVEKIVRSEMLDDLTCSPCLSIDGEIIEIGSANWADVSRGPYAQCEGGDRCRGVNIEWNE